MSKPIEDRTQKDSMVFEKLNVSREGAVLFAAINAPPMNLEGPELIRDLVSLIQRACSKPCPRKQVRVSLLSRVEINQRLKSRTVSATSVA